LPTVKEHFKTDVHMQINNFFSIFCSLRRFACSYAGSILIPSYWSYSLKIELGCSLALAVSVSEPMSNRVLFLKTRQVALDPGFILLQKQDSKWGFSSCFWRTFILLNYQKVMFFQAAHFKKLCHIFKNRSNWLEKIAIF
jgi:hypothetical protein